MDCLWKLHLIFMGAISDLFRFRLLATEDQLRLQSMRKLKQLRLSDLS